MGVKFSEGQLQSNHSAERPPRGTCREGGVAIAVPVDAWRRQRRERCGHGSAWRLLNRRGGLGSGRSPRWQPVEGEHQNRTPSQWPWPRVASKWRLLSESTVGGAIIRPWGPLLTCPFVRSCLVLSRSAQIFCKG